MCRLKLQRSTPSSPANEGDSVGCWGKVSLGCLERKHREGAASTDWRAGGQGRLLEGGGARIML